MVECSPYYTLYNVHCPVYNVHVHCIIHDIVYRVYCTLYTIHLTLCIIHCTPYTAYHTLLVCCGVECTVLELTQHLHRHPLRNMRCLNNLIVIPLLGLEIGLDWIAQSNFDPLPSTHSLKPVWSAQSSQIDGRITTTVHCCKLRGNRFVMIFNVTINI